MRAANITMAPVTPSVAKLLHALQAELLTLPRADEIPAGSIVLQPRPQGLHGNYQDHIHARFLTIESNDYGYRATFSTPYTKPDWGREHNFQPGNWQLEERRRDSEGHLWTRYGGIFVQDDFGMLVEVPR